MRRLTLALVTLLLAPAVVAAQVYKWTDAHGTVHYSESPPPQGTPYKQINRIASAAPRAAAPAAARPAPEPEAASDATVPDTPRNREDLCRSLQDNITVLQGSAPVVMQQGGKSVALSADERARQLAQARTQYSQFCGQ